MGRMAGTTDSSLGLLLLRLLSLLQFLSLLRLSAASCYYPNGDLSANDLPCSDAAPNSGCCGQGFACLSNGICEATGEELLKPDASQFVRGSCTDRTWRSAYCPLFCIDPNIDFIAGGMGIAKCPNTTKDLYRCIDTSTVNRLNTACDNDPAVLFFPGSPSVITTIGVKPTPSSHTSTTKASSTTSTTSSTSTSTTSSTSTSTTSSTTSTTSSTTSTTTMTTSLSSTTTMTSVSSTSRTKTTSVSSSTSHTTTATTTTSATTIANSIPGQPSTSSTPNLSVVIGGAIAGSLGGIGVLGIVIWSFLRRRRSRSPEQQEITTRGASSSQPSAAKFVGPVSSPGLQEAPDWRTLQPHHYTRASHKPAYLYEME